jgi:hypothetical protein
MTYDNSFFPNTTQVQNNTQQNGQSIKIPKVKCINGQETPESQICLCYPGWIDDNTSSLNVDYILKCNKILEGFSNITSDNKTITNSSNSFYIVPSNITVTDFIPV